MDILFFMNNKIELLMLQIKAPLDHLIAAFYFWFITLKKYILYAISISNFRYLQKNHLFILFHFFFLIKLYQMSKLLFYSQYYTTFGFAKQNKTLSISIQNNNDYTYIYLGEKTRFIFYCYCWRDSIFQTIHYLELERIVFLTQNIK